MSYRRLQPDERLRILQLIQHSELSYSVIAQRFGCSKQMVQKIAQQAGVLRLPPRRSAG